LGSPKIANGNAIPIKIVSTHQVSYSSNVKGTPTRHQYAGPAFANSPTPDCLPQPSFLIQDSCSKMPSVADSPEITETRAVPMKLVFDDVQHSPSLGPQVSTIVPLALSSPPFVAAMPYFVMADIAPFAPGHVHHFQPGGQVYHAHAFADPSAHLKRLLNISVA